VNDAKLLQLRATNSTLRAENGKLSRDNGRLVGELTGLNVVKSLLKDKEDEIKILNLKLFQSD